MSDARQRLHRFSDAENDREACRPLLAIMLQCSRFRGDPEAVIKANASALGGMMGTSYEALMRLFSRVDQLERDMSYRERALRAERYLKQR